MHPGKHIKSFAAEVLPTRSIAAFDLLNNERCLDTRELLAYNTRKIMELEPAALKVSINKTRLGAIDIVNPKNFKKGDSRTRAQSTRAELTSLLERLCNLPDNLNFRLGINLIIGENGSGKTTLCKALFYATLWEWANQYSGNDRSLQASATEINSRNQIPMDTGDFLASNVAKALQVEHLQASGWELVELGYQHFPDIIGIHSAIRNRSLRYFYHGLTEEPLGTGAYVHSHRQTIDRFIFDQLKRNRNSNPGVYFFDEPETGMSPRRHNSIIEEISACAGQNSIFIVATNSVILFNSNLPRVDLDYPDLGLHIG